MLFNSLEFLLFFPIVTSVYFLIPHKYRWAWLLAASCFFYMAFIPIYILILLITIVIDYIAGILIERSEGKKKQLYLVISIVSTCMVLFVFKYFNFFNNNFEVLARALHLNYPISFINIILPIGLSFHTFQSLSYVIEVYRGKQKAERHFGIYSLYVMFYPQLVAGPIERPQNLLHQFREIHYFSYQRVTDGLKLMAWGLFKKIVIADRLAILVNQVYSSPYGYSGLSLIIATVFFAFQIYCDFSGYSDIAIGTSQVMGFKLMDNFNRPYFSKSIAEFWKRWHISLSTWFRDYLYIALGGNKVPKWRWQFNLFITFLISGLWHGASWNFIVWGALNGFYLIFSIWTLNFRKYAEYKLGVKKDFKTYRLVQILVTFSLVCFTWIFFRAENLSDAWYIVTHLFVDLNKLSTYPGQIYSLIDFSAYGIHGFLVSILSILFMELIHFRQRHSNMRHMLSEQPAWLRWSIYYVIILLIILFGVSENNNFIYFQF